MKSGYWVAALLPLALGLGCSKAPEPRNWTVQGVVTSTADNKPINGAKVQLFAGTGAAQETTTDANGSFTFTKQLVGDGLIVQVSADGFYAATVHASAPSTAGAAADGGAVFSASVIDASAQLKPIPAVVPPPTYTVQGVILDSSTGAPVSGATVSLYSGAAAAASATTDANGTYTINNVASADSLFVQVTKSGYSTGVFTLASPATGQLVINGSGSITPLPVDNRQSLDLSGWVHADAKPANGAQVKLYDTALGTYPYETTTDATGHFTFTGVKASTYELRVWPYDADGNGVSDYRLFCLNLGQIDACPQSTGTNTGPSDYGDTVGSACSAQVNLSNLVIELQDKSHEIDASSFVDLSTTGAAKPDGYPLEKADLAAGVTAVLQDGTQPIYLHFGSEVDTATAAFELTPIDVGTSNRGAPIALTVAWDHNVIATLTPAAPLTADNDQYSGYELRILSLRFQDGTLFFNPASTDFGSIDFDVQTLGTPLDNPTPALYFANKVDSSGVANNNPVRVAASVAVDSNTLWLLDGNGDFLYGKGAGAHFNSASGFQLTWSAIPNAASYKLYGRNTTNLTSVTVDAEQWQPLNAGIVAGVDPNGNPTVYAAGVMAGQFGSFGKSLSGLGDFPWDYGNGVEIAVTSVDRTGFESPIDTAKTLVLKDTSAPFIEQSGNTSLDTGFTNSLSNFTEAGHSFTKVMSFRFSEPMDTTLTPTVTPVSGNITSATVSNVSWDVTNPDVAVQDSRRVGMNVKLKARGTCTELMADRYGYDPSVSTNPQGDLYLPVRDASIFSVGGGQSLIFVSPGGVAHQADGIAAIDNTTNIITLQSGLNSTYNFTLTKGMLVCSISPSQGNITTLGFVNSTNDFVTVNDATIFYTGERVLFYKPGTPATRVGEFHTITHVDTQSNTLVFSNYIDPTVLTGNVVLIPMPFQISGPYFSEYTFRNGHALSLKYDYTTGGSNKPIEFASGPPADLMVGDSLLIDGDGDLNTTTDQAVVVVKQMQIDKDDTNTTPDETKNMVTVDLPNIGVLLHTKAVVYSLGDSFSVSNVADTSGTVSAKTLNPRGDTVSSIPDITIGYVVY